MAGMSPHEQQASVPLRDRVIRERNPKRGPQLVQQTTASTAGGGRPQRKWLGETKLKLAMEMFRTGQSIRRIALDYDIPKSTLHNYVTGRTAMGSHQGPERYLSEVEEEALVAFVLGCADVGYPKTVKEILANAQAMVDAKAVRCDLSTGWWFRFKKRHPELTVRQAESLSKARMAASSRKMLNTYYDKLQETLTENGLMNKPGQIFNCDESGFPLDYKTGRIVTRRGQKHTFTITSGNKTQITVMACVSAAGYALPPLIVFDRKGLNPTWTDGEVPGSRYGLNQTGWMDSSLFEGWFQQVFLPCIPTVRPVLLLLDGHSSHYNPAIVKQAARENIIIFCLPPNTTHLVQPLDRTCFSSLKHSWHDECRKFTFRNPGKVINRANFCKVFGSAWGRAMNISNITASFKMTGIVPFDRHAFKLPEDDNTDKETDYVDSTNIAFIPFFSPSRQQQTNQHSKDELAHSQASRQLGKYTEAQLALFEQRYDNGYDLLHDEVYNTWLQENHPNSSVLSQCQQVLAMPLTPLKGRLIGSTTPKPTFKLPPVPAPQQIPTKKAPVSKVLTSEENIQQLEEKAKQKADNARKKELRRQERDRKTREREMARRGTEERVQNARKTQDKGLQKVILPVMAHQSRAQRNAANPCAQGKEKPRSGRDGTRSRASHLRGVEVEQDTGTPSQRLRQRRGGKLDALSTCELGICTNSKGEDWLVCNRCQHAWHSSCSNDATEDPFVCLRCSSVL